MSKSILDLTSALRSCTHSKKAAADPTNLADPDEKGEVTKSKGEGSEEITPPLSQTPASKTDALGNPPSNIKLESNGGDENTTKCAGKIDAAALMSKLATAVKTEGTANPTKPTPAKDGEPTGEPTEEPMKEAYSLDVQVARALRKSASGRALLLEGCQEVLGAEAASDLLKRAAAAGEQEELAALQAMNERADFLKVAAAVEQQQEEIAYAYHELTKEASAEDCEAIDKTAYMIKIAASACDQNPLASAYFADGVKIAAAMADMAQGREDPAAMAAAMDQAMPPAPEGEPGIEEVIAALEELVAEGSITPEDAEAIVEALAAQLGGGDPTAAGPTKMASAEGDEIFDRLAVIDDIVKFAAASA